MEREVEVADLCITGVSVHFEADNALDGVTLDVASGAWLALAGPNGAGKTTLLRAMAAALPLAQGMVALDGRDIRLLPARGRAREMAVLPQDHAVPEGWTVEQIVSQGRAPHTGPWRRESATDRAAITDALRTTSVEQFAHRPIETLSGGERQRVLLARALAQTPRILLLDEPTAFLDLQFQWEMLELVESARRERGLTVVSVLHDLNLAAAFATEVVLLKAGRIAAMGTPLEVLTEPAIEAVYGRRVSVGRHPATGRPTILSWPSEARPNQSLRIHVISGGGTGAALLRRLVADGHAVTAGVLNVGDSDWETAKALGLETADEAPFSAISPPVLAHADTLVRAANIVLVAPMPVGPGNLENLRLALNAATRNQPTLLIGPMDETRDFTHGAATQLWQDVLQNSATPVPTTAAALETLATRKA